MRSTAPPAVETSNASCPELGSQPPLPGTFSLDEHRGASRLERCADERGAVSMSRMTSARHRDGVRGNRREPGPHHGAHPPGLLGVPCLNVFEAPKSGNAVLAGD